MIRAMWTAATGMNTQQTGLDVIANNLANVNTTGFKRSRSDFQDLMYHVSRAPGTNTSQTGTMVPSGIQLGHGVKTVAASKIFTSGDFRETGNELDLAIEGEGFFQIQRPNGEIGYTRDGSFKLDSTGQVVTSDGYPLEPAITIPEDATQVTIGPDGTVSVLQPNQTAAQDVGTIQLANFINPAGLISTGKNLYSESGSSGAPTVGNAGENGVGTISQGFLEMSNVSMVEEMVMMITAQRAYEMNSKAIQAADEMLSQVSSLKR